MKNKNSQFRNLVFEGGGVKGIAYIGAMQILSQHCCLKQDIKRVGGTSAGAINALIFALGYDVHEQLKILNSTDFKKFMDSSFGIIRDINRLVTDFGWYKGDFARGWLGSLVEARLGSSRATFADLRESGNPDLYVIGTNLSTGYAEIFSHERFADMPLVEAVRISMSIPLFFAARRLGEPKELFVDGGVVFNYPIKLFDRLKYIEKEDEPWAARTVGYYNKENAKFLLDRPDSSPYVYNRQTLGLRLDTEEEIALFRYNEKPKGKEIKTFTDYARALFSAVLRAQENLHLHTDDWQRTVYINTLDVKPTDFALSVEKKRKLFLQGIEATERYFKWFNNREEAPLNRKADISGAFC